jgi:hypothetical protein
MGQIEIDGKHPSLALGYRGVVSRSHVETKGAAERSQTFRVKWFAFATTIRFENVGNESFQFVGVLLS